MCSGIPLLATYICLLKIELNIQAVNQYAKIANLDWLSGVILLILKNICLLWLSYCPLLCDEGKYAVPRHIRVSEGIEIKAKNNLQQGKGFVVRACLGRTECRLTD